MVHAPAPFATAVPIRVNLYSDTQTKPSRPMREAMLDAEVGDEQSGSDPTINALCERMAALLGKEAAMFLPSGTMCNEVAILTHCRPGDEILAHHTAHIISSEGGAPSALAGAHVLGLPGPQGMFDTAALDAAERPHSRYAPPQRMVEVEQTANLGGGAVWDLDALHAVAAWAHDRGMVTHMDGARLMNAVVAAGVPRARDGGGLRQRLARFHEGLGRPRRRRPGRQPRVHRPGLALEAAHGRRLPPGRHRRRRLPVCAGPQHRPPGRRPRERQAPRPRPGPDSRHHRGGPRDQPGLL